MTKKTLNIKGKILDLSTPKVMGILNLNNDSFYDGGKFVEQDAAINQVSNLIEAGVDILDIGPSSSKPGQSISDQETELNKVLPLLEIIKKQFPELIISIDTYHAKVAAQCIDNGAHIINDISAGNIDDKMFEVVAEKGVPYIMMHMQGTPENMQDFPEYDHLINDIIDYFLEKVSQLRELGVKDIVVDPGFGFGKTMEHNYQILKHLTSFSLLELPLLAGLSRKSMIYKYLETDAKQSLNGTTALNMLALQNGAQILRVHDVKAAKETIKLYNYYNSI